MSAMRSVRLGQKDLFARQMATAELEPSLRAKLAPLLRSLLAEAAGVRPSTAGESARDEEAGDDQDHA
jgi:hypothetical protein